MRCCSCNEILSDEEAVRKSPVTQDYLDMCNICLSSIAGQIPDSFDEYDDLWDAGPDWDWDDFHGTTADEYNGG